LSGLPPHEIGHCKCTLGDALNWCLWVGKTPTGSPVASSLSNCAVVRSKSNGELFTSNLQNKNQSIAGFSMPPTQNLLLNAKGVGLGRSSTLLVLGFTQDPLMPVQTVLEVTWQLLPWTSLGVATSSSLDDSPPTPSLLHFLSSIDLSSGNQTIQMSSFINVTLPPGQFVPFSVCDKVAPLSSDLPPAPYAYMVQPSTILNVDPTFSLSLGTGNPCKSRTPH